MLIDSTFSSIETGVAHFQNPQKMKVYFYIKQITLRPTLPLQPALKQRLDCVHLFIMYLLRSLQYLVRFFEPVSQLTEQRDHGVHDVHFLFTLVVASAKVTYLSEILHV